MEKSESGFYLYLKQTLDKYDVGDQAIRYLPDIFLMLSDLLNVRKMDSEDRRLISSALGYFVAPFDEIPEEIHGAYGYYDDLYICCVALQRIIDKYGIDNLRSFWSGPVLFDTVFTEAFETGKEIVDRHQLADKIKAYVGLE